METTWYNRIVAIRLRENITQAQLAHILNLSPSTIGMYEQGRRNMSLEDIVKISEIFGVSTDFILKGERLKENDCLI